MQRRTFLQSTASIALGAVCAPSRGLAAEPAAAGAVQQAHAEIWNRFIDAHGVMLDFTALDGSVDLPTPEECRAGMPNALGWWSPIENGAMFSGMYMDAAVHRWQRTRSPDNAAKTRKLMEGLLLLNSVSEVKGFVGRGVSTDGRSHYAMGSNDQTLPWFYGLQRYLESGLASPAEKERIAAHILETAEAVVALNWAMPAEPPFQRRGSFSDFSFDNAPRLLFVCRMLYALTNDPLWERRYRDALAERGGPDRSSRLELCERGMVFHYAKYHSWTSCSSAAVLRWLWEMEQDDQVKAAFARGLEASADLALQSLPLAFKFDPHDASAFDSDWRLMNRFWNEQTNEQEAQDLAHRQLKEFLKASPRRARETEFVREPTAAAWVVSLDPDADRLRQRRPQLERVFQHFDYAQLYYSQFFWVECAWERLIAAGV